MAPIITMYILYIFVKHTTVLMTESIKTRYKNMDCQGYAKYMANAVFDIQPWQGWLYGCAQPIRDVVAKWHRLSLAGCKFRISPVLIYICCRTHPLYTPNVYSYAEIRYPQKVCPLKFHTKFLKPYTTKYAFYEVLKIDDLRYLSVMTSYVLVRRAPVLRYVTPKRVLKSVLWYTTMFFKWFSVRAFFQLTHSVTYQTIPRSGLLMKNGPRTPWIRIIYGLV